VSIAGNATCLPCHVAKFWPAYLFIARRRLLPTVSTRPRTPASTLMPDEEDERHVCNDGADLPDAEMTNGCESPILSVARPRATSVQSDTSHNFRSLPFYPSSCNKQRLTTRQAAILDDKQHPRPHMHIWFCTRSWYIVEEATYRHTVG
jgi:hypothetical protein